MICSPKNGIIWGSNASDSPSGIAVWSGGGPPCLSFATTSHCTISLLCYTVEYKDKDMHIHIHHSPKLFTPIQIEPVASGKDIGY